MPFDTTADPPPVGPQPPPPEAVMVRPDGAPIDIEYAYRQRQRAYQVALAAWLKRLAAAIP